VAAVTPHLDRGAGHPRWRVDTSSPDKVLTVEGEDVPAEKVADLVGRAGFRLLGRSNSPGPPPRPRRRPTAPPAQSYYPLLLILLYLLGVVGLMEWRAGGFDWMRAMGHFMAGFFLVFSFFKLLAVRAFANSYAGYDVVAARWPAYGLVYPFIELGLGVAYLLAPASAVTNLVTLAVMSVSTVGVVQSLLARRTIRCACLGAVFNLPMSYVTLVEDLLMVLMAVAMLVAPTFRDGDRGRHTMPPPRRGGPTAACCWRAATMRFIWSSPPIANQWVTVYVLDGAASRSAPVETRELKLTLTSASDSVLLPSSPQTTDPPGRHLTSRARCRSPRGQNLVGALSGDLNGVPFQVELKAGHAHKH
jgi:hypothetical protein